MKKTLWGLLALTAVCLYGEEDWESKSYWDFHPAHVGGNGLWNGSADLSDQPGHLLFNKENVYAYMLLPISRDSFFIPRIEWNTFKLDWNRNPRFKETRFKYIQYALTFYSTALEKWKWILRAEYNMNQKHSAVEYGLFSTLAWGAYELNEKWHYHIGFLTYMGLRGGWVYPLIGLDYALNKEWRFQVIFPIDYSIQYSIGERWRLSLKARPLRERFRVDSDEPHPRSIFNYSSIGTEFNVHYEQFLRLEIEAFAGYNWGGTLYIKDHNGKNALYTDFGGAPYGGASLNFGF